MNRIHVAEYRRNEHQPCVCRDSFASVIGYVALIQVDLMFR